MIQIVVACIVDIEMKIVYKEEPEPTCKVRQIVLLIH